MTKSQVYRINDRLPPRAVEALQHLVAFRRRAARLQWYFADALAGLETPSCARVVWQYFPADSAAVVRLVHQVGFAIKAANAEIGRPRRKGELASLNRVIATAKRLRQEVTRDGSPMPKDWMTLCELANGEQIAFVWHRGVDEESALPVVSLVDVLTVAIELAQEHIDRLPPRAVQRIRGTGQRERVLAFRRSLAVHLYATFLLAYDRDLPSVVAAVANGIVEVLEDDPLTTANVRRLVAEAPPAFRRRSTRTAAKGKSAPHNPR